jgi:acetyl-CoA decarbonylase/synthase complex subunit gamma
VFVTANYKLSFDHLRRALSGKDGWILVLNTQGVNVWCAAAKGAFGTEELLNRIAATGLARIVSHRRLILPQLSAPGVAAHEVERQSRFKIVWGPVRSRDIPAFLNAGMKATAQMRKVTFDLADRMIVAPIELIRNTGYLVLAAMILAVSIGFSPAGYSVERVLERLPVILMLVLAAAISGIVIMPALMPWVPGRALSFKGAVCGLAMTLILLVIGSGSIAAMASLSGNIGAGLLLVAGSSMLAMVFTGSSAHTSPSGTNRETRIALPIQIAGLVIGMALWYMGGWPS